MEKFKITISDLSNDEYSTRVSVSGEAGNIKGMIRLFRRALLGIGYTEETVVGVLGEE